MKNAAFQPRTQEILQTMNLLHKLDEKGHRLTETSFWMRDGNGALSRSFTGAEVVHRKSPHTFHGQNE